MAAKCHRRHKYFHINKYQLKIILLSLIPSLIVCLFTSLMVRKYYFDTIDVLLFDSVADSVEFITKRGIVIVATIWAFFIFTFILAVTVSGNLVGAFLRIIKELDEILEGKDKKQIMARKRDGLANELLVRINKVLEKKG